MSQIIRAVCVCLIALGLTACSSKKNFNNKLKRNNSSTVTPTPTPAPNTTVTCQQITVGPGNALLTTSNAGENQKITCSEYYGVQGYTGEINYSCLTNGSFEASGLNNCLSPSNEPVLNADSLIKTSQLKFIPPRVFASDIGPAGPGGVYYSNGAQFCWFKNPESYAEQVPDLPLGDVEKLPDYFSNIYDGICGEVDGDNIKLAGKGPFLWEFGPAGADAAYYSDGEYFCHITTPEMAEKYFPNEPLDQMERFVRDPNEMSIKNIYTGICVE